MPCAFARDFGQKLCGKGCGQFRQDHGANFNPFFQQDRQKHFGGMKTVNLGIGGDRMEHILWRLDHGALDGASPKVIVLMIGVNNAPLVQANGVPVTAAAHGIKLCIENLRLRCPQSQIVLVKILPAFDPSLCTPEAVRPYGGADAETGDVAEE
jgi:lysophospholipase L1-like esterase